MAQHDYTIANQGFPAFRSDLNDALAAIVSNNSGATEPTTMFAHQLWVDTAANPSILKIRNADNDAWITIGSIDQTGDTFTLVNLRTSGPVVFNDAGADVDFRVEGDTNANLLFVDASADAVGIGTSTPNIFSLTGVTSILGIQASGTNQGGNIQLAGTGTGGSWINFGNETIRRAVVGSVDGSALAFYTNGTNSGNGVTERMRIDSSGYIRTPEKTTTLFGVDVASSSGNGGSLTVKAGAGSGAGNSSGNLFLAAGRGGSSADNGYIAFGLSQTTNIGGLASEYARIDSSGRLLVGKTATSATTDGVEIAQTGNLFITRGSDTPLIINRQTNDGTLVEFRQANTQEGTISVSGNTVSYNPFLGSHAGALADWSRPDIKIGTVMDTINELLEYKVVVIDVQEEVSAKDAVLDEEGNEVEPAQEATTQTVQKRISYNGNGAVGSTATVEYEGQEYTGTIQHEREEPLSFNKHLKVKINDTAASKTVFGVFVGWNNDANNDGGVYNDMLVGAVGNYVIRMAAGQTPEAGDLVEADGNGCAVVQDDDIIRTKTIAKVTSTIPQVTYDDGSFLVTCVLYCG